MRIAVLYCGSSYLKQLMDKLLHYHIDTWVLPCQTPLEVIQQLNIEGIIITGSGSNVNDPLAERIDPAIYDSGIPVLGICYGMQLMAKDLGGSVGKMLLPERQLQLLEFTEVASELYQGFADGGAPVWMAHSCRVTDIPDGFLVTGRTKHTDVSSMENADRRLYGVQFHPEHKGKDPSGQAGSVILWAFLHDICGHEINPQQ